MSAVEQLQDQLAVLVGDRQGLDSELLLRLQSLQTGGSHVHVRVDERGHAVGVVGRQGGVQRGRRRHSVLRGADQGGVAGDRLQRGANGCQQGSRVGGRHLGGIAGSQRGQIVGALVQ